MRRYAKHYPSLPGKTPRVNKTKRVARFRGRTHHLNPPRGTGYYRQPSSYALATTRTTAKRVPFVRDTKHRWGYSVFRSTVARYSCMERCNHNHEHEQRCSGSTRPLLTIRPNVSQTPWHGKTRRVSILILGAA